MKKTLLVPLLFIACTKKEVPPTEEPAKPEFKIGYVAKTREYYPQVDQGVGSQDSAHFLIKVGSKTLKDIKLKMSASNTPLNLTAEDSVRVGDIVQFTTTAIIRMPSANVCTFKADSTWIQNKTSIRKLKSAETFTYPVTYSGGKAVVTCKREYTVN